MKTKIPEWTELCSTIDDYRKDYIEYVFKDNRENLIIKRSELNE